MCRVSPTDRWIFSVYVSPHMFDATILHHESKIDPGPDQPVVRRANFTRALSWPLSDIL